MSRLIWLQKNQEVSGQKPKGLAISVWSQVAVEIRRSISQCKMGFCARISVQDALPLSLISPNWVYRLDGERAVLWTQEVGRP